MRERLELAAFQAVRWLVLALPLKSAQRLGMFIGRVAYTLISSRRTVALNNLRHAFPEKSRRELETIAKGAFQNYGIALMELLWFPHLTESSIRSLLHPQNLDLIERRFSEGKGMVMLSGHFGSWELIALGMAHLCGHPFTVIVQTQSNVRIDAIINRHRCLFGNRVVPMNLSVRESLKTLHEGGIVAIAPDQSGPMEGVFVNFFGRRVASHQGPAALALRSGSAMMMGFMVRQPDLTYDVIVEQVNTDNLHGSQAENVEELTQRHTALLESYIRKYPDHWLWMHRRWKHTWEEVQLEKQGARHVSA
ncbi:MAG TPA: lysophospholipid acyltransferase family protein [Bacteroidota bacterium]|nr:lysophospholipid acyltransferase family protein [Bacteroidota bacterium]